MINLLCRSVWSRSDSPGQSRILIGSLITVKCFEVLQSEKKKTNDVIMSSLSLVSSSLHLWLFCFLIYPLSLSPPSSPFFHCLFLPSVLFVSPSSSTSPSRSITHPSPLLSPPVSYLTTFLPPFALFSFFFRKAEMEMKRKREEEVRKKREEEERRIQVGSFVPMP